MNQSTQDVIAENIRRARTLRGVPPDRYVVPYRSIAELLERQAAAAPDKSFIYYYNDDSGERSEWTYGALNRRVNQFANLLRERYGVCRGEKVAMLAFNHPDSVIAYFACWKLGAAATPQNAAEDDSRIEFILQNAGCRVMLVAPDYIDRANAMQAHVTGLQEVVTMDAAFQASLDSLSSECCAPAQNMLEDQALLVYTSGTTGSPKGVMLSQYNLLCNCQSGAQWQNLTANVRMMCVLPIHHVNGLCVTIILPLYIGASVVLNRSFRASTFWQRIAERRVNIVSVVPTIFQFLCEADEDVSRLDLHCLSQMWFGAGTMSVSLVNRFTDRFKQKIVHGYGLSETTAFACLMPPDLSAEEHHRWLTQHGYPSIGAPLNINEMAIHDEEGNSLPAGMRGEIVLRGHNIMLGYFNRDDANQDAFKYGWFRSGDEGFFQIDERGRQFFFITGRIKELINRGGVKYSPFEIEEVLQAIPGVKVGLAIAFDNEWYGEEVGAYIVKEQEAQLTEADVLTACRRAMPFSKSPKVAKFGDEIPVTTTGKYQRLKLKDLFVDYRDVQFKEDKPSKAGQSS
jgi:long-chain acyl-CoA synthetase